MLSRTSILILAVLGAAGCSSNSGTAATQSDGGGSGSGGGTTGSSGGNASSGGTAGSGGSSGGSGTSSGGGQPDAASSSGSTGGGITDANAGEAGWATCPPSWTATPSCGGTPSGKAPDFGPNVLIFDPATPIATIQSQINPIFSGQQNAEFSTNRYAYLFKPGNYNGLDVQIGYYMQALGLGQSPDDVTITGGLRSRANGNATTEFWRGIENMGLIPSGIDGNVMIWAVSQGTHLRRLHAHGALHLSDGGNSSGGFIADSLFDGLITPGSQQQWFTRNSDFNGWNGANWNIVFAGDGTGPLSPAGTWPNPPMTVVPATPLIREKPFLYLDPAGNYMVMVPGMKTNATGHSWTSKNPPGSPISIDLFYIAKPTDTAATINAALASGKHLLLTPGIYKLEAPIQVNNAGTVVLGLGLPSLLPTQGTPALTVGDVDGVTLAGFLLDAGPTSAPTLLQVGPAGSSLDHAGAPSAIFDVHCRVGGAEVGTAASCVTINSNNVLTDNTWYWRADHGAGAGWTTNKCNSGLIVNGNNVSAYGLFVEHHQQYQTLWNGNGGSTYFYQSELPYDPPNQAAWQESAGHNGYPSYKLGPNVTTHTAEGLGIYAVFNNSGVSELNAIETPTASGIVLHHMVTVSIRGVITYIVNNTGATAGMGSTYGWSTN